ncbi:MAG: ATP-binding protein [Clostridiales bacterium]|nr:ATP-binding protein [Clostridiales bacterium]
MFDYESRHMIEALRSGIPSRSVGKYFSEARPRIMRMISDDLEHVRDTGASCGKIIAGKYGEGKTHLLNTVFGMAHDENMVVSYLSLSKEAPFDRLYLLYQKLAANTYLPGHAQPGFMQELDQLTPNSAAANEMQLYAAMSLETDKLYYLLRAYLNTEDQNEKYLLQSDLEGNFTTNAEVKRIYYRIFGERVKYKVNFSKTKHAMDYFNFLSHLFLELGYNGWVILFDETELIGRLGKKTRLKAYRSMAEFLMPGDRMASVYTLFALGASYTEDVIEAKHEYETLAEVFPEDPEPMKSVLDLIVKADQLQPLTREEMNEILMRIQSFHGRAYDWNPQFSLDTLSKATSSGGYLLRTKIRAAIEFLDQMYQYGQASQTDIGSLNSEDYSENVPDLSEYMK